MPTLAGPDTHAEPDNDGPHRCMCCYALIGGFGQIHGAYFGPAIEQGDCERCGGRAYFVAAGGDSQGDHTLDDHRDAGAELLRRELAWARRKLTVGFDPARRAALIALRNYRELLGIAEPI